MNKDKSLQKPAFNRDLQVSRGNPRGDQLEEEARLERRNINQNF